MKPGKPLTFAEILRGSTDKKSQTKILAFGLPGNPVSCMVCFHLFLVPAIRQLSGWTQPHLPRFMKVLYLCVSISPPSFHFNILPPNLPSKSSPFTIHAYALQSICSSKAFNKGRSRSSGIPSCNY